jgi:formamidopyrimidine-DNA glycosylase
MPELPEVETVCRRLREAAIGAEIARARVFRPGTVKPQAPASVSRRITGRRIEAVVRRGKNIFVQFSGGAVVRVHLRMTGNLRVIPDARLYPATTRVLLAFSDGRGLIFDDPRALGVLHVCGAREAAQIAGKLGPEPLSPEFTPEVFAGIARRSKKPAKLFLMDQGHVAGLGNIYAAEALFRARIHPARPVNRLSRRKLDALHVAIVSVLKQALTSVYKAYRGPDGIGGGGDFPVRVYGREGEPCLVCGRSIRSIPQGGRSTYFCPGCQRA